MITVKVGTKVTLVAKLPLKFTIQIVSLNVSICEQLFRCSSCDDSPLNGLDASDRSYEQLFCHFGPHKHGIADKQSRLPT